MIVEQTFESVPVDTISPHPSNPRRGDTEIIKASIKAHGFFGACVVQRSTGYILVGNHRWQAAVDTGETDVPVLWADVDDEKAKRILIADNRTAELAHWDETALHVLLAELAVSVAGLDGLAFSTDDLASIAASQGDDVDAYSETDGKAGPPSVVMADPLHNVHHGQVFKMGRHVLVVAAVTSDWSMWLPYLKGDAVFCPHPSPFLPLSSLAIAKPLVMVTSSTYLAGHVLDKWTDAGNKVQDAP